MLKTLIIESLFLYKDTEGLSMKFSELSEQQWGELGTYLDTCVIPITGLTGVENPVLTVAALSELQTLIDMIEKYYKGRVVIYPALHYIADGSVNSLVTVINNLKITGFKHVVVISAQVELERLLTSGADLCISTLNTSEVDDTIKALIPQLWN